MAVLERDHEREGWKQALADMTAARDAMGAALADSRAELERLREALGWYARGNRDDGERAKDALGDEEAA